jgi:hypothetical protein
MNLQKTPEVILKEIEIAAMFYLQLSALEQVIFEYFKIKDVLKN